MSTDSPQGKQDPCVKEECCRLRQLINEHYGPQNNRMKSAIEALYFSAYWHADRPLQDENGLWSELRDAAGIPAGQTSAVLGPDRSAQSEIGTIAAERAIHRPTDMSGSLGPAQPAPAAANKPNEDDYGSIWPRILARARSHREDDELEIAPQPPKGTPGESESDAVRHSDKSETPRADGIVDAYLDKCDTIYPDGTSAEDIERDLREPVRQLERELNAARSAIAPIRMTEVIGQDGRPVAAPCAIDGCQFVKSAGDSDVRQNVDTSQEMQTVRNSIIEECARVVADAKITLFMDGSREGFENAGFDILYLAAKLIRGLKTEGTEKDEVR